MLLLAWVLPSFIQGVSGFGTPIAVAAPLLVALGIGKARAVALPADRLPLGGRLRLDGLLVLHGRPHRPPRRPRRAPRYAAAAAVVLGVNCVLSGVLVALMDGGWHGLREGWRLLVDRPAR